MKRYKRMNKQALVSVVALISAFLSPVIIASPSQALSGSDFQPGYIISDENFFAANSLNQGEISSFLVAKSNGCNLGYTCLKDYSQRTSNIAADRYCNGYAGGFNESAATIIAKTSVSCGISPKVLIVLLQKEQGLVTSSSPAQWKYNSATGMGCPDTAACDPSVSGFFYQVFYAARSFKYYIANNDQFNYHWGQDNQIQFNPNRDCGTQNVFIRNPATAALYIYTPYVPSPAALADLYGSGSDPACSAYGNRNFWRYYNDWFGNPTGNTPVVALDSYQLAPGSIKITGWALDVDTTAPIQIHAYFNNVGVPIVANVNRPDLATNLPVEYRKVGTNHGFSATIPVPVSGPLKICLYAINVGSGEHNRFDCRETVPLSGGPIGSIDGISTGVNTATVRGWALDPDLGSPIQVHFYARGRGVGKTIAVENRPDVGAIHSPQGSQHGYSTVLNLQAGVQDVCAYGIESGGRGGNTLLGCRTITVLGGSPQGTIDSISSLPGKFVVSGWAFEQGFSGSTPIHVYVNGVGIPSGTSVTRPDVQRVFPAAQLNSGYSVEIPASSGENKICVYAIDKIGSDSNNSLGCRTLIGRTGSPFGSVDNVSISSTGYGIRGWAIDPDQNGPISLHTYIDGKFSGIADTAGSRPDVMRVFPGYEDNKGFNFDVNSQITSGKHQVCIYGINRGPGDNALISCTTVVIP